MAMRVMLLLVLAAASAGLWVVNCSGPRPAVAAVRLVEPGADGAPYRVEAAIHNRGRGHGQVAVTVRLRDAVSGQAYQKEESLVLGAGETAAVVAEIQAPPGRYVPQVTAEYPPR